MTTSAPTCPGQDGQLGALSQTNTTPVGATFIWGIIQKNNLCSHPESFLPATQYFFFTKINILTWFSLSLSLHLPEINNYFFLSGAPTSFKCLLESCTLTYLVSSPGQALCISPAAWTRNAVQWLWLCLCTQQMIPCIFRILSLWWD